MCMLLLFRFLDGFRSFFLDVLCVFRCLTEGKEDSTEEFEKKEDQELPEYLRLHQMVVRRIGEICRIVNQVALVLGNHLTNHIYIYIFFFFTNKSA